MTHNLNMYKKKMNFGCSEDEILLCFTKFCNCDFSYLFLFFQFYSSFSGLKIPRNEFFRAFLRFC